MQFSVRMELYGKCMTSIFPYMEIVWLVFFGHPGQFGLVMKLISMGVKLNFYDLSFSVVCSLWACSLALLAWNWNQTQIFSTKLFLEIGATSRKTRILSAVFFYLSFDPVHWLCAENNTKNKRLFFLARSLAASQLACFLCCKLSA